MEQSQDDPLVRNAVGFLTHPKVQTADLGRKLRFLQEKGLTVEQMHTALKRTGQDIPVERIERILSGVESQEPASGVAQYGPGGVVAAPIATVSQTPLWKDITLGCVGVAAVTYGAATLLGPYLPPTLQRIVGHQPPGPSATDLEARCAELDVQLQATKDQVLQLRKDQARAKTQFLNLERRAETTERRLEQSMKKGSDALHAMNRLELAAGAVGETPREARELLTSPSAAVGAVSAEAMIDGSAVVPPLAVPLASHLPETAEAARPEEEDTS